MRFQRGFTLIELLLSVAIISMLTGLSLPFYASFQARNEIDVTATTMVDMLRRAQHYSRSGNGDSQWGVAVQAGNSTLFRGNTYATRDVTYDETTSISAALTTTGLSEVVYTKLTGLPSSTGSITLTSRANESRTLTLNAKGMVNY